MNSAHRHTLYVAYLVLGGFTRMKHTSYMASLQKHCVCKIHLPTSDYFHTTSGICRFMWCTNTSRYTTDSDLRHSALRLTDRCGPWYWCGNLNFGEINRFAMMSFFLHLKLKQAAALLPVFTCKDLVEEIFSHVCIPVLLTHTLWSREITWQNDHENIICSVKAWLEAC